MARVYGMVRARIFWPGDFLSLCGGPGYQGHESDGLFSSASMWLVGSKADEGTPESDVELSGTVVLRSPEYPPVITQHGN